MLLKPNFNLFRWQIVCTSPRILKLEDIKIICIFLPTGRGGGNYPRWVRGRARWHSGIQRSLQPFTARMCQLHATVRVRGGPGDGDRAPPTQDSTSAASPPAVAPGPAARCRRATGRPRRARIRPTPRPLPGRCWGRERLPRPRGSGRWASAAPRSLRCGRGSRSPSGPRALRAACSWAPPPVLELGTARGCRARGTRTAAGLRADQTFSFTAGQDAAARKHPATTEVFALLPPFGT